MTRSSLLLPHDPFHTAVFSREDLANLAVCLAQALVLNDIILLTGEMGVGKTTFVRDLLQQGFGVQDDVPSPTFPILYTYETSRGTLYHYDLYRIKSADEVVEIGIDDAFTGGISVVEWPGRLRYMWPSTALEIQLSMLDKRDDCDDQHVSDNLRRLTLIGDASWKKRLNLKN